MVTLTKYGAKYNRLILHIEGLSTELPKPTVYFYEYDNNGKEISRMVIQNGSIYTEIDTGKTFMYDAENTTWYEVSIGGGGGTSGGIVLVGTTTTQLTDGATTNPITVDGQSYTAQPNDAVIYQNKEFLFDGTNWHEFGDLSGLSSQDIGAMTGYVKAQTAGAIAATDTLNEAVGKLEKGLDGKQATIDANNKLSADNVDDSNTTHKFATAADLTQIQTNKNDILNIQQKTVGMDAGGNNYISVNGHKIFVDGNTPTGASTGDFWLEV